MQQLFWNMLLTYNTGALKGIFMSNGKNVVDFRKRIKIALVKAFDSKCQVCGEKFPEFIFDFHHLNPEGKSFGLGDATTTRARSAYANEAKNV